MIINFYGIHGIDNIQTVKKQEKELKAIHSPLPYDNFKVIKDVLDEVYNSMKRVITADINIIDEYGVTDKHVNWFVENRCNWKSEQYRLDSYYVVGIHGILGPTFYVIVLLKQVMYVDSPNEVKIFKFSDNVNIVQTEIPQIGFMPSAPLDIEYITEDSKEFKDAFTVVRRSNND